MTDPEGFSKAELLDDGEMWPTHFAIPAITDGVKDRMRALLRKAVGG